MLTLRKVLDKCDNFFQNHYTYIWSISVFTLVLVGFLHFELKQHNKDLIYWIYRLESLYNELEYFALIMIMIVIIIKVIFLVIIILMNNRSMNWFDELSQLEVKKRYGDFLFLRLITDIDRIEKKFLCDTDGNKLIPMEVYMLAHDDMRRAIDKFRRDVRKLLTPNEVEIALPIEEVYCILEDDERAVRQSRFYHMDITVDDETLKKLLNP